jgi:hypothetical protein
VPNHQYAASATGAVHLVLLPDHYGNITRCGRPISDRWKRGDSPASLAKPGKPFYECLNCKTLAAIDARKEAPQC